jgi:hypothetical protein
MAIGKLTPQAEAPYVFALPDGDSVLFGQLPDGRVSFARGSEAPARRVAARVVVPSGAHAVRSLAASAAEGGGLVLSILRQVDAKDERADDPQVDVELHWLDARGNSVRAPLLWKTRLGIAARAALCGEQLYLAWDSVPGVLVTRMSASGVGRAQTLWPPPGPKLSASLGVLQCTSTGASLVAGWQAANGFDLQAKVCVARITSATEISRSRLHPGRARSLRLV